MEEPKRTGRPPDRDFLTDDEKTTVLDLAYAGKTARDILEYLGMSARQFAVLRDRDVVFRGTYALARQEGLEQLADDLINIPDTYADVLRGRLKSENVRWLLSKRKAETYGDRVELNVNHQVDIGTALTEARQRALPGRYTELAAAKQVLEISSSSSTSATGSKPVEHVDTASTGEDDDIFS